MTDYLIKFCILYFFQIGDLPGHYHLRHDDVDELNKEHNRDKTDRLLLEKEVGLLHCGLLSQMKKKYKILNFSLILRNE